MVGKKCRVLSLFMAAADRLPMEDRKKSCARYYVVIKFAWAIYALYLSPASDWHVIGRVRPQRFQTLKGLNCVSGQNQRHGRAM